MKNKFEVEGDAVRVFSSGKNSHLFFYIDLSDLDLISRLSWRIYLLKNGYKRIEAGIFANGKKTTIILSRFLLNAPQGELVDHKDCDPTNNRRLNLRIATRFQNSQNAPKYLKPTTSKYKGVSFHKQKRLWFAYINSEGRRHNLGYFRTEEDAARAYNLKCKERNIDFARLNEIR